MSRIAASAFKGLSGLVNPVRKAASVGKGIGLDFSSPLNAFAFGVPTALFAGDLAMGLGKSVKEEFTGVDKELRSELRRQRYQAAQAMKAQRLQRAMADNMTRLAAANPQLYNQLLVGKALPQGAVVIGGGQRSDFLESVAYQMATGGFGNPQANPDSPDIMQTLVDSY